MTAESQSMEELASSLKGLAGASTADLIGIAPGSEFKAEELGDLGEAFGEVKSIVVLAHRLVDPVQLVRFSSGESYRASPIGASFADALLRDACWRIVELLRDAGWRATIPRNLGYGVDDPSHSVSFKKAAVLAGFGAFGKSQLVIHPEWGPWLMLRTVVTDASLEPDRPLSFAPCEGCDSCVQGCPGAALTGRGFDRTRCFAAAGYRMMKEGGSVPHVLAPSPHGFVNCEECLRACPVGDAPPRLQLGEM
jgi:epoxyqueuosine reductase QueG